MSHSTLRKTYVAPPPRSHQHLVTDRDRDGDKDSDRDRQRDTGDCYGGDVAPDQGRRSQATTTSMHADNCAVAIPLNDVMR